jgi:hypothetical protein
MTGVVGRLWMVNYLLGPNHSQRCGAGKPSIKLRAFLLRSSHNLIKESRGKVF